MLEKITLLFIHIFYNLKLQVGFNQRDRALIYLTHHTAIRRLELFIAFVIDLDFFHRLFTITCAFQQERALASFV